MLPTPLQPFHYIPQNNLMVNKQSFSVYLDPRKRKYSQLVTKYWYHQHSTDLCVSFSVLLNLFLWCFNIITVAIHVCGFIYLAIHLVRCQLVFFLFLLWCWRFTVCVLLLLLVFQLLLLLLLLLLALLGLFLYSIFKRNNKGK